MQTFALWYESHFKAEGKITDGCLDIILQFVSVWCALTSLSLSFSFALFAIHQEKLSTFIFSLLFFLATVNTLAAYDQWGTSVWWIMNAFLTCCCLLRRSFMEWCNVFFRCNTDRIWIESHSGPTLFFQGKWVFECGDHCSSVLHSEVNETSIPLHPEGCCKQPYSLLRQRSLQMLWYQLLIKLSKHLSPRKATCLT